MGRLAAVPQADAGAARGRLHRRGAGASTPPSREYAELRQAGAEDNAERFATEFVLKLLKKRLFS